MNRSDSKAESGSSDALMLVGKPPLNLTVGDDCPLVTDNEFWQVVLEILDTYDVHLHGESSGAYTWLSGPEEELWEIRQRHSTLQFMDDTQPKPTPE